MVCNCVREFTACWSAVRDYCKMTAESLPSVDQLEQSATLALCFVSQLAARIQCLMPASQLTYNQGVIKRCRLSWLTNSALVYETKCGGRGCGCGVSANEYSCTYTQTSNKLWRSTVAPYLTFAGQHTEPELLRSRGIDSMKSIPELLKSSRIQTQTGMISLAGSPPPPHTLCIPLMLYLQWSIVLYTLCTAKIDFYGILQLFFCGKRDTRRRLIVLFVSADETQDQKPNS